MPDKVESLYTGDIRLDNLEAAITNLIFERVAGQNITYASVVGILVKIIIKFVEQMSD